MEKYNTQHTRSHPHTLPTPPPPPTPQTSTHRKQLTIQSDLLLTSILSSFPTTLQYPPISSKQLRRDSSINLLSSSERISSVDKKFGQNISRKLYSETRFGIRRRALSGCYQASIKNICDKVGREQEKGEKGEKEGNRSSFGDLGGVGGNENQVLDWGKKRKKKARKNNSSLAVNDNFCNINLESTIDATKEIQGTHCTVKDKDCKALEFRKSLNELYKKPSKTRSHKLCFIENEQKNPYYGRKQRYWLPITKATDSINIRNDNSKQNINRSKSNKKTNTINSNNPNNNRNSGTTIENRIPSITINRYTSTSTSTSTTPISTPTTSNIHSNIHSDIQSNSLQKSDFQMGKKLGSGNFSTAYIARHKKTGSLYALKVMQKKLIKQQNYIQQVVRQIKIQFYLDHQNIVQLYGVFDDDKHIYLLMEYCCDGQLFNQIRKYSRLDQKIVSPIIKGIANGIQYLHRQMVIHRDLKPQNVFMSFGIPKIGDFGWAVHTGFKDFLRRSISGSPLYYSPEIVKKQSYDNKIDVWGLGMIAFESLVGMAPFKIYSVMNLDKILHDELAFPTYIEISPEAISFIEGCLKKKAEERWSIANLQKHKFLNMVK